MKEQESIFDKALSRVVPESRAHAVLSIIAANRARTAVRNKTISVSALAARMNKDVGEMGRILSGRQLMTRDDIALLNRLEAPTQSGALG